MNTSFTATAWAAPPPGGTFPEAADARITSRPNVGLAISGGGARAYSATIGLYRGLRSLGLMESPRYISSISGGTWASSVYTFYARGAPGVAANDDELLGGPPVPAANLTLAALETMPPRYMGAAATDPRQWNPYGPSAELPGLVAAAAWQGAARLNRH